MRRTRCCYSSGNFWVTSVLNMFLSLDDIIAYVQLIVTKKMVATSCCLLLGYVAQKQTIKWSFCINNFWSFFWTMKKSKEKPLSMCSTISEQIQQLRIWLGDLPFPCLGNGCSQTDPVFNMHWYGLTPSDYEGLWEKARCGGRGELK